MRPPTKPTGHAGLSTLGWILVAAGLSCGLASCVVPGASTFVIKPEPVAAPPLSEIAGAVPVATEQTIRPASDAARDAPRRELVFPNTDDLPSPQAKP